MFSINVRHVDQNSQNYKKHKSFDLKKKYVTQTIKIPYECYRCEISVWYL